MHQALRIRFLSQKNGLFRAVFGKKCKETLQFSLKKVDFGIFLRKKIGGPRTFVPEIFITQKI